MKFVFTRAMRRRAACIGLSAVMCASLAAGQFAAFASDGGSGLTAAADSEVYSAAFENANGKIDLTKIKLENLSKDVIENTGVSSDVYSLTRTVIVTLQGEPLSERSYDGKSARDEIADEQQAFLYELNKAGISYEYKSSYYSIANAVAIDVKLSELARIKHLKGVSTVSVGSTYARPKTIEESDGAQTNASNIYGTGIYDSSEYVKAGHDGSGISVAVLDTGLDYTHEAFKTAPKSVRYTEEDVADLMDGTTFAATRRSGATVDDVYISEKVPFAYDYADSDANVYPSYSQHGTHVAGIVAGQADSYTDKNGNTATAENDEGNTYDVPFRGVAPEAQLVICKVFTDNLDDPQIGGAEAVDILDALEDCWNLNVDVINMSLGTSGGFSSRALCPSDLKEEDEEGYLMKKIYERIRAKGISLIVAASNDFSAGYGSAFGTNLTSNPDSGTVGSPSTFTGALSVASINGQYSPYFTATPTGTTTSTPIYFEESRNEDSDPYDFVNEMLALVNEGKPEAEKVDKATFRYVVVPGTGEPTDFALVAGALRNKQPGEKVIAVVKRGYSPFKDKITNAATYGADAVVVYNNVSGLIRMSLGDMRTHIPAVSVTLDAGLVLTGDGKKSGGTITVDRSYSAGPFMNDYSSWGSTPDLKLKPDVTSHGGEITSTVAGGYEQMSGTSMACPNLAGFEAIFKGYLKSRPELWQNGDLSDEENALALTKLTNNIVMSTATTVYDQNKLPYSPRKQGAGLATLANVFGTKAYLYTDEADGMCEDGRPKAELGDDPAKKGVYTVKFHIKNFDTAQTLTFKTNSIFMTETVGKDNMSVAEMAHIFGNPAEWTVGGNKIAEGNTFTVAPGADVKIEVKLTLSAQDKEYLNKSFKNGMFVEGFLQLLGTDGQCDLNLPFMGFYGDWKAAPMMDLTCFDVAKDAMDTSLKDEDRAQPQVWATQIYGYYAGEKYTIPLGSFLYIQDEAKEHTPDYVYVEEEHIAVSRDFHRDNGDDDPSNYLTTTGIKALYAGLLRNAEVVTYTLTNVDTGEIVKDENGKETRVVYRANKSFAGGGNAMPSQVLTELKTEDLGLAANGKYRLDFNFYFDYQDYKAYTEGDLDAFKDESGKTHGVYENNSFSVNFYIDYEAPVLVDSRIRFQNMKDSSNRDYQKVYLDLDIYDNHYPQAVILCYSENDDGENTDMQTIKLATDYVVPVINPAKNTINTVSIDISDFYEQYGGRLFVEIDDYALNHNTYYIIPDYSKTTATCPGDFKLTYNGEEVAAAGSSNTSLGGLRNPIVVEKNTAVKFGLENTGNADASNFAWSVDLPDVIKVKNGELFAVGEGTAALTVRGGRDASGRVVTKTVRIKVEDTGKTVTAVPRATFGTIINSSEALVKAENTVKVNSDQQFTLTPNVEPWYYPTENLVWTWRSGDNNRATVDGNGNVKIVYEGDYTESVEITAEARLKGEEGEATPLFETSVTLEIQPAFRINGTALTNYSGLGGVLTDSITVGGETFTNVRVLKFPENKSIQTIADDAFEDCVNVEIIVIPKSVTSIAEDAFEDCKNLKAVCFIDAEAQPIADSSLTLIHKRAFNGCENLTVVDLSNCKVFTVDREVFAGCAKLKKVVKMTNIGTMHDSAFAGCTSLESADISKLHIAGSGIFTGCTSLTEVITSDETIIGDYMFSGCTALENVEIKCAAIAAGAFRGCSELTTVKYTYSGDNLRTIGARAFENCTSLTKIDIVGTTAVASLGDFAFANCVKLQSPYTSADFNPELGNGVFRNVPSMSTGAVIKGNTLVHAPEVIDAAFAATLGSFEEIAPNAFSDSRMAAGVTSLDISSVTKIGAGAFRGLTGLQRITLNAGLTEIPAYAFYGCTDLTEITIPAGVTAIGNYAFYGCASLATTNLSALTSLKSIGSGAFGGTAVTSLVLPDGLERIGDEAFARCGELAEVTINSVKTMGSRVFALCPSLERAAFGANAETTGEYTFSTVGYGYDYATGGIAISESIVSALTTVEFGDKIVRIGAGVFAYDYEYVNNSRVIYACDKLTQIDLNKVTEIGESAFAGCINLATVTGIERVKVIGAYAFQDCAALTSADLSAAEEIYPCAFETATSLENVTFGDNLLAISDYSFYLTKISGKVTIPAGCGYVGMAAFARTEIEEFEVAEGNANYTSIDGVLYRYIDKNEGTYELVSYPTCRTADTVDGLRVYAVEEGTVSILAYAFNNVQSQFVYKVRLPYTLKLIGHGAFLDSSVNVYSFESVQAPTLLQNIMDNTLPENSNSYNSFFYINFGIGTYLTTHAVKYPGDSIGADVTYTLSMEYPSNGMGYENYIYNGFFGTNKVKLSEQPEDSTRELKKLIENFAYDVETILGWKKGVVADEVVKEFSETVKQAHALYNGLRTEAQTAFVTQANIDKMFEVEAALKQVKPLFGLAPAISTVAVSSTSSHRTAYTEGERFSTDGLKLLVTYDDYSTEEVDAAGNFKISDSFNRALRVSDRTIPLQGLGKYAGKSVRASITVSKAGTPTTPEKPSGESGGDGNGISAGVIAAIVVGAVVILAAAAVAVVIVLKKRGVIASKDAKEADGAEKDEEEEISKEDNQLQNSGEEKTDD